VKTFRWLLFISYLTLLLYVVFFLKRREGLIWEVNLINYTPFKHTLTSFYSLRHHNRFFIFALSNLVGNILLLAPFPYFFITLFNLSNTKLFPLYGLAISVLIELMQFYFKIGIPDIDDVILNVMGVYLGYEIYKMISKGSILKIN
jgi:glycopeptide antibiotics resistance protein